MVANEEPENETLKAPWTCPATNSRARRTSSTDAPSGESIVPSGGCAPTNGPRFSSTMFSMFGGRGVDELARSWTNSSWSTLSAWLKRRSKPIVEDAFELMPAPQREPATCPG